MSEQALASMIRDGFREMREGQRNHERELQKTRTEVRELKAEQASFAQAQEACTRWNEKHERAHGLDKEEKPSPWVANQAAWAWHHPKRALIGSVCVVALFIHPVRQWLTAHIAWAFKAWW